jgi:hypothetical protein
LSKGELAKQRGRVTLLGGNSLAQGTQGGQPRWKSSHEAIVHAFSRHPHAGLRSSLAVLAPARCRLTQLQSGLRALERRRTCAGLPDLYTFLQLIQAQPPRPLLVPQAAAGGPAAVSARRCWAAQRAAPHGLAGGRREGSRPAAPSWSPRSTTRRSRSTAAGAVAGVKAAGTAQSLLAEHLHTASGRVCPVARVAPHLLPPSPQQGSPLAAAPTAGHPPPPAAAAAAAAPHGWPLPPGRPRLEHCRAAGPQSCRPYRAPAT